MRQAQTIQLAVRATATLGATATLALAGCGDASAKPTAATGCKGLPTAKHSVSLLTLFGAVQRLKLADVCAHLGAPQKVTHDSDGLLTWVYGDSVLTFRRDLVIQAAAFDRRPKPNATYSIQTVLKYRADAQ